MDEYVILNDKEFLVVKRIELNKRVFLYAFATDSSNEYSIVEETVTNGITYLEGVTDNNLKKQIFEILKETLL